MDEESAKLSLLIQALDQPDKKAVREAVETLIPMATGVRDVAARLCAALDAAPAEKRWPIAYVLAHVSPLSTSCVDALKGALGLSDPDIRWAVVLLLVRLAKKPEPAVAAHLIELLHSGSPTQRRMAVYCLRDIGVEESLRVALQYALADSDPLVRVAAVTSLKAFPGIGGDVADQLLRLVAKDLDSRVRASAALALAHVGAPSKKILATLNDAIQSPDTKLAKAARAALALLEQKGPVSPRK
jgi:HEAT repeat protein